MKDFITTVTMLALLAACTGKESEGKHQENVEQNQTVMTLNIDNFKWTRQPESCVIKGDTIEVVTKPGTDLWQRTYYHLRNDNAPVFQMETEKISRTVVFQGGLHRHKVDRMCMESSRRAAARLMNIITK